MLRSKRTTFFVVFLIIKFIGLAQTERFKQYTTKDGLLSDEIYNLHQDKKGYIWIFTNYGALKYNSVEFKPVLKNLPFNESFIYSIYENEKGQKWVANSNARIFEVINDSAFIVKGTEAVSEKLKDETNEIRQLYVDDSLNIYAVTKQNSYKFIKKGRIYFPLNLSDQIDNDSIIYKVLRKERGLIPIFNYRVVKIDYSKVNGEVDILLPSKTTSGYTFFKINLKVKGHPKFFKEYGNDIYFSVYDELCKNSGDTISCLPLGSFINNFTKDKNSHTWLACLNTGLLELDERDSVVHHYLENITVNDVLIDSQNGLWASSAGHGLFHCKNLDDLYLKENNFITGPISFLKQLEDRLFIATVKGDLFMVKNNKTDHILNEKNLLHPLNIAKSNENYLISFGFGIKEIRIGNNGKSRVISHINATNAIKIIHKKNDSLIYLARKGFGIIFKNAQLRRTDFNFKTYDCELRKGDYLLATDKGIYKKSNVFTGGLLNYIGNYPIFYDSLIQPEFLLPSRNSLIKKITKDSLHRLWFSSIGNGIFMLDNTDSLKHLTVSDGLPSNIVKDISFTPDDYILLCTNKGLFISSVKNRGIQLYKWIKIYPGEVENALVFENKIYINTKTGLSMLKYEDIKERWDINFNLNSIYINSAEANADNFKDLTYNQNNLEFKFDVICFSDDRPGLKYYLSGPVADSGQVSGTAVKFLNLPPGNYSLTVFPDINKGETLKIPISFRIIPAWWQTITFLISLGLFILLIIILSLWLILRNARKKREQKDRAKRLILEYKLIALKAQINPHFISNCLSAIQHLIMNNKVDAATHYIARFGLLVRQILNFSTRSLVSVKEELEIASLNVELEQLRFENKFSFEAIIDEKLDTEKVFIPALILNPIIENAIWHGLLPLKNKRPGKLLIEVKVDSNILSLIIEDNGVGNQSARQSISNSRQSKGIQLTEQRLGNLNYLYNIDTAQFIFSHLFDNYKNIRGTRVIISLPLNLSPLQNE